MSRAGAPLPSGGRGRGRTRSAAPRGLVRVRLTAARRAAASPPALQIQEGKAEKAADAIKAMLRCVGAGGGRRAGDAARRQPTGRVPAAAGAPPAPAPARLTPPARAPRSRPAARPPSPTAKVRRDGHAQVVPAEELVPGDIVLLKSGDKVPADVRLISATNLQVGGGVIGWG
jgi:magnesium-transporting ATPase (P-type)